MVLASTYAVKGPSTLSPAKADASAETVMFSSDSCDWTAHQVTPPATMKITPRMITSAPKVRALPPTPHLRLHPAHPVCTLAEVCSEERRLAADALIDWLASRSSSSWV